MICFRFFAFEIRTKKCYAQLNKWQCDSKLDRFSDWWNEGAICSLIRQTFYQAIDVNKMVALSMTLSSTPSDQPAMFSSIRLINSLSLCAQLIRPPKWIFCESTTQSHSLQLWLIIISVVAEWDEKKIDRKRNNHNPNLI